MTHLRINYLKIISVSLGPGEFPRA